MWEYRLVWPGPRPPGWDSAWQRGLDWLTACGREVEARPDAYLVLLDRPDAGLKLRGGKEEDFDLKVLHSRKGGWELWEKVAFFRWDALEIVRLAALLRFTPPPSGRIEGLTPGEGVAACLDLAGVQRRHVTVGKRRVQAAAGLLMAAWPASRVEPGWLAELVEIALPGRDQPVFSLCLETVAPLPGEIDPVQDPAALRCGYPELLLRHLTRSI